MTEAMTVRLAPNQRSLLTDLRRHARTLKQYHAARALLTLDRGALPSEVARDLGLPPSLASSWSRLSRMGGIEFVIGLGDSKRRGRLKRRMNSIARRLEAGRDAEAESLSRQAQAMISPMAELLRLARTPTAEGADLDADPAELFRPS